MEDVEAAIASGDTAEALRKLRNLRRRVDGCEDNGPDNNDWVIDCEEQEAIRGLIDALIDELSA